jgi:hypothetical protein
MDSHVIPQAQMVTETMQSRPPTVHTVSDHTCINPTLVLYTQITLSNFASGISHTSATFYCPKLLQALERNTAFHIHFCR